MTDIEQMFKTKGIYGCTVSSRFYSRKNQVFSAESMEFGRCVVKVHSNPENCKREIYMLKLLQSNNVSVPALYYSGHDYIIMECLDGMTLLDAICSLEEGQHSIKDIAEGMSSWLRSFYKASGDSRGRITLLGDVNFRNFMVMNSIYGIDFEDIRTGRAEEDAGEICAFFLTYTPEFTPWKIDNARILLDTLSESMHLDRVCVICELERELLEIEKRRNLALPEDIIKSIRTC
jgi:hypothetical protein